MEIPNREYEPIFACPAAFQANLMAIVNLL